MKPIICAALIAGLAISSPAMAHTKQSATHRTDPSIVCLIGVVDKNSVKRFTDLIAESMDKVIELKIAVTQSTNGEERYYVSVSGERLEISGGDPMDSPFEVLINGPTGTTMDMLAVDGFYLVKSGGMHAAGALSWGLTPVDEASIRLNPSIHIVRKKF